MIYIEICSVAVSLTRPSVLYVLCSTLSDFASWVKTYRTFVNLIKKVSQSGSLIALNKNHKYNL